MKQITVHFTFHTGIEAWHFREILIDAKWLEPNDERGTDPEVVVRIDAGNYELIGKLVELASDVRSRFPGT